MPDRWINPHGWGPQQPGQGQTSAQQGGGQPAAQEQPTQPAWGSPPPPPQKPTGDGIRSFLGRHPLVFFGGILGVLVLIGAIFGSSDNSTDTSQGTTANSTTYTLPTVAQTEPSSTTSPPTTVADVSVPKLVGMRATTAKKNLADRGLHWRITYKTTSRYPSGTVLSQSKQAGDDVRPGSTVALVIVKAPPVTTPPTTEPAPPQSNCDPAYPNDCIPPPPPDLDCADIGHRVEVDHRYGDPHRLDADGDGIGCDSWG
jgi:hypothetical protein